MAGKASHIAGVVARGNKLTIRLTAPAPDFPSRIAEPAILRRPAGTPQSNPDGLRRSPRRALLRHLVHAWQGVVLTRNPNYHGSRPHHFARIELAVGIPA